MLAKHQNKFTPKAVPQFGQADTPPDTYIPRIHKKLAVSRDDLIRLDGLIKYTHNYDGGFNAKFNNKYFRVSQIWGGYQIKILSPENELEHSYEFDRQKPSNPVCDPEIPGPQPDKSVENFIKNVTPAHILCQWETFPPQVNLTEYTLHDEVLTSLTAHKQKDSDEAWKKISYSLLGDPDIDVETAIKSLVIFLTKGKPEGSFRLSGPKPEAKQTTEGHDKDETQRREEDNATESSHPFHIKPKTKPENDAEK